MAKEINHKKLILVRKALCVLFLLLLFIPKYNFAQQSSNKYSKLDSLLNTQNIINCLEAIDILKTKYVKDSLNPDYWIKLSKAYMFSYNNKDAFASIDKAIIINKDYAEAYFEKARLFIDIKKDYNQALIYLSIAINKKEDGKYYFHRGICNQIIDSSQKAMNDYNKALLLKYSDQGIFRNYSILLLKSDSLQQALKYINEAIKKDTTIPENYKTKGEIYFSMCEPELSCINFELANKKGYSKRNDFYEIICKNKNPNKFIDIADALMLTKKYSIALNAYNKAIEINPDSSRYYLNRGYCYYKTKQYNEAEKDYLKTLTYLKTLDKTSIILLYENLSLLYFHTFKYDESIEYNNKIIALDPNNSNAYVNIGYALTQVSKFKEAEKTLNKALEINSKSFRAYGHRAIVYINQGKKNEAYNDAIKSLEINPNFDIAMMAIGYAKIALGEKDYCFDFYKAKKLGNDEADKVIKKYCK